MANPLDDALRSLQAPQEERSQPDNAARNAAIINQFNHANVAERVAKNRAHVSPPNYDALMQKLHGIDALLVQGNMVPPERMSPTTLKMAQTAQAIGKHDLAYNILNEENRKLLSRDAIGGSPLSTSAWERLRDNAGRQAVSRHHVEEAQDTGPVKFPGGMMRQQETSQVMASPTAKDDLYRIGVESFDRQFGKHKHYLVEDALPPNPGTAPIPPTNPAASLTPAPSMAPGLESIIHNAGAIGQQQQQGSPIVPPPQFAKALGVES